MRRRKIVFSESDMEKMKQKRMFEYMMSLVDRLSENASMFAVHVLDDFLAHSACENGEKGENLEKIIEALEMIVPMSVHEYKYNLAILYKLISRVGGELAEDVLDAFEQEICEEYLVKSVTEVGALDRREVVRRLCKVYKGLVRFRVLSKAEKKAEDSSLARNLHKSE